VEDGQTLADHGCAGAVANDHNDDVAARHRQVDDRFLGRNLHQSNGVATLRVRSFDEVRHTGHADEACTAVRVGLRVSDPIGRRVNEDADPCGRSIALPHAHLEVPRGLQDERRDAQVLLGCGRRDLEVQAKR
jgi:hypothetical protein